MQLFLIFLFNLAHFGYGLLGGIELENHQHNEFVVSIQDIYKNHLCGGTIYADRFILTAASCVEYLTPNDLTVFAGEVKLDGNDGIRLKVDKIIRKAPTGKNKILNDIAMLRLTEKLIDSLYSADLPQTDSDADHVGEIALFHGWGKAKFDGPDVSNTLNIGDFELSKLMDCKLWNNNVNESHICIYSREKSLCKFDAGGPLMNPRSNILWGIATNDINCYFYGIGETRANILTRVYSHKDWIEETARTEEQNTGYLGFDTAMPPLLIICEAIMTYVFNLIFH